VFFVVVVLLYERVDVARQIATPFGASFSSCPVAPNAVALNAHNTSPLPSVRDEIQKLFGLQGVL
jgi:hypothetical protein